MKALSGGALRARIGIHSGEVLAQTVATDFSTDFDASGLTVHIASRLEKLAPEGSIAISASTSRRARPFVITRSFGQHAIRGLSTPLDVYLLTALRHRPTSQRFWGERELSTLVGRESELALLDRGLERAAEGEGCAIGFVAEAGVGKSRLCFEFAERCRTRGVIVLEGRALAHTRVTPYVPVVEIVRAYCGIGAEDAADLARQKIGKRLASVDSQLEADLPLMLDFLGLAESKTEHAKLDPTVRRERLKGLFRRRSAALGRPILP